LKTLLVTSEITYVPGNYYSLFEELLKRARPEIAGLVILENMSWKIVRDGIGLRLLGCKKVAKTLFKNALDLKKQKREKLFRNASIPVIRVPSMNDPRIISWIKNNEIDLVVNLRTRCIYKKEILNAPRLGCINIHHGHLPQYRGTLCDLYALYENRPAGFTVHRMNEKIDAGEILAVHTVSKSNGENDYIDYLERTGIEEAKVLADILIETAETGNLPTGIPNTCEKPTYTRNPNRQMIRNIQSAGIQV
jgi:methionyl-tRNA formyltransferase